MIAGGCKGIGNCRHIHETNVFGVVAVTDAAYRSSRVALNALTVSCAHAPADDGIKVNALAPGLRRTDPNASAAGSSGDPAEAAAGAIRLALLPDDGPAGSSSPGTERRSPGRA